MERNTNSVDMFLGDVPRGKSLNIGRKKCIVQRCTRIIFPAKSFFQRRKRTCSKDDVHASGTCDDTDMPWYVPSIGNDGECPAYDKGCPKDVGDHDALGKDFVSHILVPPTGFEPVFYG